MYDTTNRRVNGIENVVVPRLERTVHYIISELDEEEREEYFRRKKVQVKKRMERAQKEEYMHAQQQVGPKVQRQRVGTMAATPTDAPRMQQTAATRRASVLVASKAPAIEAKKPVEPELEKKVSKTEVVSEKEEKVVLENSPSSTEKTAMKVSDYSSPVVADEKTGPESSAVKEEALVPETSASSPSPAIEEAPVAAPFENPEDVRGSANWRGKIPRTNYIFQI